MGRKNALKASVLALVGIAMLPSPLAAQENSPHDLSASADLSARESFHEGLTALHNFHFSEARDAFAIAREADPDFVLTYWGEALTHDFPFGPNPDVEAAQSVLSGLGATQAIRAAKARNELELGLLTAVEALFGEGERQERENAYHRQMSALFAANPDHVEIAAFYALSILGKIELGSDLREKVEAVAVLEKFLQDHPRHPGLLHYAIHAYDDAILAPLGLRAASIYADVAPQASHALHMPSHIFLQLGMWDETVESNIDAYRASIAAGERSGRGWEDRDTHALSWLVYGLIMQGRPDEARRYLTEMETVFEQQGGAASSITYALTAARYAVETGDWGPVPGRAQIESFDNPYFRGILYLADARKAISEGRTDYARETVQAMSGLLEREDVRDNEGRMLVIGSSLGLARAALAEKLGNRDAALVYAKEAAELESRRPLPIGPTYPLGGANEYHGELLLAAGRYAEAVEAFEKALSRSAGRPKSLEGLARARAAMSGG